METVATKAIKWIQDNLTVVTIIVLVRVIEFTPPTFYSIILTSTIV